MEQKTFCQFCGTELSADVKFCPECGREIEPAVASDAEPAVESLSSDAAEDNVEAVVSAADANPASALDAEESHVPPVTPNKDGKIVNAEVQKMLQEDHKKWLTSLVAIIVVIGAGVYFGFRLSEKDKDSEYPWTVSATPELYKAEIEDIVRYNIALLRYYIHRGYYYGSFDFSDSDDTWAEEIGRITNIVESNWKNDSSDDKSYRCILDKCAGKSGYMQRHAKALLDLYDDADISLSDFKQITESETCRVWAFSEKNTGLRFKYTVRRHADAGAYNILYKNEYIWEVEPDEESVIEYLLTLI